MPEPVTFSRWLKCLRTALDLTQEMLAEQVGCAADTIRSFESGKRRPSRELAERLAAVLQVPADQGAAFMRLARTPVGVEPSAEDHDDQRPPAAALEQGPVPAALPSGTVTLAFIDIEGSTRILQAVGERYAELLQAYRQIVRQTVAKLGGQLVDSQGDGCFVVFPRAVDAVQAALAIQRALATHAWPDGLAVRSRIGLHTGEPRPAAAGYVGLDVHRAARIAAASHGGQILLSGVTASLVRDQLPPDVLLQDLGAHRLKDLERPEHLFQLVAPELPTDFPPLRTLDVRPTNLPVQPTPFIGRERDVVALRQRVCHPTVRLITLTGPGGTGKTRLALQVTAELLDDFPDGVWFVDLAPISDPDLVPATIAQTLGVQETTRQPLRATLHAFLRDKHVLLVLDNFEQVIAAAPLVAELLATTPGVTVVVTSRMVLHLQGEHEFLVLPLAVPEPQHMQEVAALAKYEAVALFLQRAQAVKPDFQLTHANAPAVAEICQRLDGLPLAIELAAARIKLLPPQALLARLSNRLMLLTGGNRDLPTRQQTLRSAIEWSYSLLAVDEQTLFRRLGVFVGGCTVEAAEAVCTADDDLSVDVLNGVQALLDQSLLRQAAGANDEPRVSMLETIREYALERLATKNELGDACLRHATYYASWLEAAEPMLDGPDQGRYLDQFEAEHENVRAAIGWALDADKPRLAARLGAALWKFCDLRGYFTEGRRLLEATIQADTRAAEQERDPRAEALRARLLLGAGALALQQADYVPAQALLAESLVRAQQAGDQSTLAAVLNRLGTAAESLNDAERARTLREQSLALCEAIGDQAGIAQAQAALGHSALREADYGQAMRWFSASLALHRELGNEREAGLVLMFLGLVAQEQGDLRRAVELLEASLTLHRRYGNKDAIVWALHGLGRASIDRQELGRARGYLEEGLGLARTLGTIDAEGRFYVELGRLERVEGKLAAAGELFRQALEIFRAIGEAGAISATIEEVARLALERDASDRSTERAVTTCEARPTPS